MNKEIPHYTIIYNKMVNRWRIQSTTGSCWGFTSPDDAIETIRFFCDHAIIVVLGYGDEKDRTIEI